MTERVRNEEQAAAACAQAENLLKCAIGELQRLAQAPAGDALKWFPHGIDGIKVSVKVFDVEASLELEGALANPTDQDAD
ncbi:MAG TPA: hypothetical protein VFU02_02565 [Polyangiaceae bacterium]|nr:hypothetical protein [Polyangiaceae bacterium]